MAGDVSIGPFVVGETVVTSVISFLLPSYHRSRLTIVRCVLLVCVELFVKVIIAGEVIAFQLLLILILSLLSLIGIGVPLPF